MKRSLIWKLLGVNILVIGFVMIIVWLTVDHLAARYFVTLMQQYNISPVSIHEMFVHSVHRYLIWATLAAVSLAMVLSFLMMRRLLGPLTLMTKISREISSGDYSSKLPIRSQDEMGQLAAEFNRMADSLQAMERLRKIMMIDVAHELRTPLTNIQGYLEAMLDGVVPYSKENFELLHEETLRLVDLVESILQLARADAARMTLHKTPIQMGDLIEHVLETFQPQLTAKEITVEPHWSHGDSVLQGDTSRLSQVISNLIQNAVQYSQPGGTVKIFTESTKTHATVAFANPVGELSEKDLPFIFERFYRGEKSRSRRHGGAGIGLAIVKELIEAHNGTVGAEISNGEARIWFSLPI